MLYLPMGLLYFFQLNVLYFDIYMAIRYKCLSADCAGYSFEFHDSCDTIKVSETDT